MSFHYDFLPTVLVEGAVVVASAGTAVPLSTLPSPFSDVTQITIKGMRPGRVYNTGSVWIGFSSASLAQYYELIPGETLTLDSPANHRLDLNKVFVDASTSGDGVVFEATNGANG